MLDIMIATRAKSNRVPNVRMAGILLLTGVVFLQGCAPLLTVEAVVLVAGGAAIVTDPSLEGLPRSETNRATLSYPIADVYSKLIQTVERNGRSIVETLSNSYSLRVSYPFSFLANNWGGVITISCIAEGSDTTVIIVGSGRDTNQRIQRIGDEIINDLKAALTQAPEMQVPAAAGNAG